MIQNMSTFLCPHCQKETSIFGSRGVERECSAYGIDFLGDIPLHASICNDSDRGQPTVISEPDSTRGKAFEALAEKLTAKLGLP